MSLNRPRINNNIMYNNRQLNTIYNNSTPTMKNISNLNISVPSYNTNPQSKSGNYTSSNNKQTKQFQKNIGFNYSEMDTFQLINNIEIIGKDQTGCRFLQRKIQDDKNFLNNFLYPKVNSLIYCRSLAIYWTS
jgi:D-mannonate dehydratase